LSNITRIAKGFDLDYMWKSAGSGKDPAAYYMAEAEGGNEPAGRWYGPAALHLGFELGQQVERGPYDLLFGEHVDPRDGTSPLGRPPGAGAAKAADLYREMLAAEPHATAERQHELRNIAAQQARQGPLYFDLTTSFCKSVSVFHASLGENARQARETGDAAADARWSGLVGEVDEMLYAAVRSGFDYFQREAGYTRTGHHGKDSGKWEEAELAVVHWLQHTSRDEDMQLHIHSQIAHVARTILDGKWRAPDSRGYGEFVGAVSAHVALHLESALTRRFGLEWVTRKDGVGRELKGIAQLVMDMFSSRRAAITAEAAEWARKYEAAHGRKPSQRLMAQISQQATLATRKGKPGGEPTSEQLHQRWAAQAAAEGVDLAAIARSLIRDTGGGTAAELGGPEPGGPTRTELERAAQQALDLAQGERSSWTRADLIRHLGRVMPSSFLRLEPAAAVALLDSAADLALSGEAGEAVRCLEAPRFLPAPDARMRADGRSVYQRHGGTRYAARVQLTREERLLQRAQRPEAPALARDFLARELGADATALDAQLHDRAQDGGAELTGSGLRLDQAAALWSALTDGRTATVMVGPAGSGKTRTLAEAARIWEAPGGVAFGVAPSQAATNVMRGAGISRAMNFAEFLGHTKAGRGERGLQADLPARSLILIDEGSMFGQADMADILRYAAERHWKVIISGDQEQLAAVEGGGGMMLLARRLGFVQLAYPVRFRAAWERDASLRLRAGDRAVLAEYDAHGRVRAGAPEQIMDEAARAYVARYLAGRDVLLMASDHADCRELSRRIRDDLVHLGRVDGGRWAALAEGARASAGDLIIARENDHQLEAGETGRTLANGDVLLVESVNDDGSLTVRRAIDADRQTGARRFTERAFTFRDLRHADSAYAVTGHSAQGRTVADGLALIRGTEDRQWTYVAMSRATDRNTAYVMTTSPRLADPQPGARPAPELDRYARIEHERQGLPPGPRGGDEVKSRAPVREALGILADNIERDGAEEAALEVLRRELADATRLDRLRNIFETETEAPRAAWYAGMLADELAAAEYPFAVPDSPRARWLWRTLEAAELAGQDPRHVLRQAIGQGSLEGARDVTAVIRDRALKVTAGMVPLPAPSWSEQVPEIADPALAAYVTAIAAVMDERTAALGEFTAEHPPAWALNGLGPVPAEAAARERWQERAASVAGYREAYGYADAADPIGFEPAGESPAKRAAWAAGFAALGPADGADLRALPDGSLLNMARSYETETAWAPRYVADELRHVRSAATDAGLTAIRADAEAEAAADAAVAGRHQVHAASARAMSAWYQQHENELAAQMDIRRDWERATEHQRRMAVAAHGELRRRHPDQAFEPLTSADPGGPTEAERAELDPAPEALAGGYQPPAWVAGLAEQRRKVAEILADRRSVRVPSEDPEGEYDGYAWPEFIARDRDAVLQPPRPEIRPSAAVEAAVRDREATE
jgi:conjugative relaxase-like TrwC/TraI family protein